MTDHGPKGNHASLSEFEQGLQLEEAIWREGERGDVPVGFETYLQDFDDATLLKEFPNDRCQCLHWGYPISDRMVVRYEDQQEVVEPGDVYYMAPDHTIAVDAGTVLIEVSPKEKFKETVAVGEKNIAEMEDSAQKGS